MDNHEHIAEKGIELVEGFFTIHCKNCGSIIGVYMLSEESQKLADLGIDEDKKELVFYMDYIEFLKMYN